MMTQSFREYWRNSIADLLELVIERAFKVEVSREPLEKCRFAD
jgi:hypothetical protein